MNTAIENLVKYRWVLFALSLVFTAFAMQGLKQFAFDASPRSYFKEGNAAYERFQDLEATYGREFRVFMMISAREGDLFTASKLRAVIEATEKAWLIPKVRRVDSLNNYQHTFSKDDELIVEDIINSDVLLSNDTILQRKKLALNDIGLVNRLVSKDGKHAAVLMSLSVNGDDRETHLKIVEQSYALEESLKLAYPEIDVAITGNLLSNYHNLKIAISDMSLMVPIMFGLMFLLIGTLLKSALTVVVSLTVAVFAAVSALGVSALVGIEFSMLAINSLIITLTITVAHCIHIFTQLFVELKTKPKLEALKASLSINFFAVSMTSLTTLVGFLSLNLNELPPAVALGNAAAIGTALSWVFSFTLLPALVGILPFKAHKSESSFLTSKMMNLSEFVIAKPKQIIVGMGSIAAVMIVLSFSNILNDRFSEIIHEPHIFRSDTNFIDEHFGALYTANYDLDSGSENGVADPHYLKHLDDFAEFLRAQPEVRSVYSFADVVKKLNQSLHNGDPKFYAIPESRELAAQYILLYEMSLPYGLDLNDQLTLGKQRSRLLMGMPAIDTQTLMDIERRVLDWQEQNLPPTMRHKGASMSIIWAHLSYDSLKSSLEGSVIALILISIILLLVLKSWRYGIVSLIPNLLPAAFGFGGWYLYSGEIGIGLTCVVIITIGIVVDDTVHFLTKYKKAMQNNAYNAEAAIRTTFKQVGPAICITTLVLSSGFFVLSLSKIVTNSALGGVTVMILIAAFILDVLLLPAILLVIDKRKYK